jgi:5'-nucleotidase
MRAAVGLGVGGLALFGAGALVGRLAGGDAGATVPPQPVGSQTFAAPSASPSCVQLVGWNDLHGHLAPTEREVDSGRIPLGGAVGLADLLATLRASGTPTVSLDAGDLFTGPLESSLAEGKPVIEAYRAMGIDAAVLGNHEFDFGPEGEAVIAPKGARDDAAGPRGALLARMKEASFPFLGANVTRADGSPTGWPGHRASVTIERGGFRVGVVGYTTDDTPRTTLPPNVADLSFAARAAEKVGAEIAALRQAGASPVVLLAHASLEGKLPQALADDGDRTGELARLFEALGPHLPDFVFAGHRHAWLLGRVRGVPVASSSQHGVGAHVARFCRAPEGGVVLRDVERRVVVGHAPPRTELGKQVAELVRPYREAVAAKEREPVAKVPATCVHRSRTPAALDEQIARATLEAAREAFGEAPGGVKGTWVGVVNAGGVRSNLRAGDVTFGDVFATFPFDNLVAYCRTRASGLERALGNLGGQPASTERFPFGLAGASVTLRRTKAGLLELASLSVKPSPGERDPVVLLALSDFLLWGGDQFLRGVECEAQDVSTVRVRDAWRRVLAREGSCDGPAKNAKLEGP